MNAVVSFPAGVKKVYAPGGRQRSLNLCASGCYAPSSLN